MPRFYKIAPGGVRLTCRVTTPPDRGRANTAVIALLAKALGVPKSAITLTAGATSRQKTLTIDGEPQALAAALDTL